MCFNLVGDKNTFFNQRWHRRFQCWSRRPRPGGRSQRPTSSSARTPPARGPQAPQQGLSRSAATRVSANGQVRLRLLLPGSQVAFPVAPPVGLVLRELENVLSEALLSEARLALAWHLAQPVGVSSAVVDSYEGNGLDATASPLGHHGWEVKINGSGSVGPGAPVFLFREAFGAWVPGVVCAIDGGGTAVGVPAMDAATPTETLRHPRSCPGVPRFCTATICTAMFTPFHIA